MFSDFTLFHYFSWQEVVLRLSIATVLGLLIGLDREVKHKPMGVRVMMLVSLTMCALVLLAEEVTQHYLGGFNSEFKNGLRINSLSIVGSFVTGLGFLGGAAIIRNNGKMFGMTTGAGILAAGAIGAACGFALYGIAITMTLLTLLVIVVIDSARASLRDDVDEEQGGAVELKVDEEDKK